MYDSVLLPTDGSERAIAALEHAGEEAVDTVVQRAHEAGQSEIESAVVRGLPAEEITEYAERNDLDIIVMATAGRTGSAREMIGSVTETVVRRAQVPVLTVTAGDQ